MRNRLITIEGIEGAGKSTAVTTLTEWLEAQGETVLTTREPGGTALGEELRAILLAHREGGMSPQAEVLLMFAARAEHIARVIKPALARGDWVVCDRFTDASVAYQGAGRGLGAATVEALAQWTHPDLMPGLTLWLDVSVEVGLARAAGRSAPDRFEQEKARFFETIQAGYAALAHAHPERIRRIDANLAADAVAQAVIAVVREYQHG